MKVLTILASVVLFSQFSFANDSLLQPGITLPSFGTPTSCIVMNDDQAFQLNKIADRSLKSPETGEVYRIIGGSQSSGVLKLNGLVESSLEDPTNEVIWDITEMVKKGETDDGADLYQGVLKLQVYGFGYSEATYDIYCQY